MSDPVTFWKSSADVQASRRDFLTAVGFGVAAAAMTGCTRGAAERAIPLFVPPETQTPGVASYYATTCGGCSAACALVVKTREGRPIKVDGNERSTLFGGTCAVGQASVLSLYDGERQRGPLWLGEADTWAGIDERIRQRIDAAARRRGGIVLLSSTIVSPSTLALIDDWRRRYPTFRHVVYDAVSFAALRTATNAAFGVDALPHFRFDRARTVVGLDADFLGTWLSPVEFTRQYAKGRSPESGAARPRHIQFEPGVSLTGARADRRVAVAPSEIGAVAVALLNELDRISGAPDADRDAASDSPHADEVAVAARALWRDRGASLVVCGSHDPATHVVVHAINARLGNVGRTVDVHRPSRQKCGDDRAMTALVDDMERGDVHVLLVHGVNPVYDYAEGRRFADAMARVALSVSFADRLDETASLAHALCPDHHPLEAWSDAEPVRASFSLGQPTIKPLFDTRSLQDSLLAWSGRGGDYYSYLRDYWRREIFPRQRDVADFDRFWDQALQDGVFEIAEPDEQSPAPAVKAEVTDAVRAIAGRRARDRADGFDLHVYPTVALGDGRHANNPWLQELPDPVTKVTWGNYAVLAPAAAESIGVADGDVVRIADGSTSIELPVYVQPGQHARTVSIALGYGRARAGKVGNHVGANAFVFTAIDGPVRRYTRAGITVTRTGRRAPLATTQEHHSMEGRPIVRELTAAPDQPIAPPADAADLWSPRPHGAHQWGMTIDLDACTGCSACVVGCQAENNVPVVGRDEVSRGRNMHWLRIDTYVADDAANDGRAHMQPMTCQHCEHAPCETVCPVLATVHSSDGINQQVYNRCVGTRYCANNCPYKVRRFNWFEYAENPRFDFQMNDAVGRLVLNPDVVVRSRGVMEKCSLCVQRIESAKATALQEHRALRDGDIQTACQQACPADAIVFGDLADPESRVSRLRRAARHYVVLGELGTKPHVGYLAKLRQTVEGDAS